MNEGTREDCLAKLLHPAGALKNPAEVVADKDLTLNEKRAILASWASDACAVESAPALRQPSDGQPVTFDDIMNALRKLDGDTAEQPNYGQFINRARRIRDLYRPGPSGRVAMG